jgi:two-component system, chemotaxis family, chemotaxis protein CheY
MYETILVVDDSRSARMMIGATLLKGRYTVMEACDGKEALVYARSKRPDLVLADYYMPGMDGLELIIQLRKLPGFSVTPMLVLTTESGPEHRQRAQQAGARGWIVKPFKPTQLLLAIENMLRPQVSVKATGGHV